MMTSSTYAAPSRPHPATSTARVAALVTLAAFVVRLVLSDGRASALVLLLTLAPALVLTVAAGVRARYRDRGIAVVGALAGIAYAAVVVYFHSLPEDSAAIPLFEGLVLLLALVGMLLTVGLLRRPRTARSH